MPNSLYSHIALCALLSLCSVFFAVLYIFPPIGLGAKRSETNIACILDYNPEETAFLSEELEKHHVVFKQQVLHSSDVTSRWSGPVSSTRCCAIRPQQSGPIFAGNAGRCRAHCRPFWALSELPQVERGCNRRRRLPNLEACSGSQMA